MTPKNDGDPEDDDSLGMLDDAASLDTAGIGILGGGTAQVSVEMPKDEDDELVDDEVVDGEIVSTLIIDEDPLLAERPGIEPKSVFDPKTVGFINASEIVIEIPGDPVRAESESAAPAEESHGSAEEPEAAAEEPAAAVEEPVVAVEEPVVAVAEPVVAVEEPVVAGEEPAAEPEEPAAELEEPAAETEAPAAAASARVREVVQDADLVHPAAEGDDAVEIAAAALFVQKSRADAAASTAPASVAPVTASAARTPSASVPTRKENSVVNTSNEKGVAPRSGRAAARTDMALTSRRLDEFGDTARESADLLTADRLLDPHQLAKPEPEGAWSHLLYTLSGKRINIGDGRRARERKALTAKIAAPLNGGARFVPVLSRKGGVGKTTITALLGMALADAREDRVIAVDANPDRGTLADRVVRSGHNRSVRDLVRIHDDVKGYHDISAIVARDATRLDVLASDSDPHVADAFSDGDYRDVAGVAAHYYSLVLTDTGTGIVHSVMSATLDLADQLVIVSGLSVDEARLASETLTWLETNGYAEQARNAIVVLNQSTPGAPLVRLNELEAHFATRARRVVRVPYDVQIAGGGTIVFANLRPETRLAARELAALLVEGLRAEAAR